MKNSIALLTFLAILGCANERTSEENTLPEETEAVDTSSTATENIQTQPDFQKYINSLPQLKLPFNASTQTGISIPEEYDKEGFDKFKSERAYYPYALVFQSDSAVGVLEIIVGDLLVPYYTIYNWKGEKIESLFFYDRAGWDPVYEGKVYITFNADLSVAVRDTVHQWEVDVDDFPIEESKKTTTSLTTYMVSKTGRVSKVIVEDEKKVERNFGSEVKIDQVQLNVFLDTLIELSDRHLSIALSFAMHCYREYGVNIDDFKAKSKSFEKFNYSLIDRPGTPENFEHHMERFSEFEENLSVLVDQQSEIENEAPSQQFIDLLNALESSRNRITVILQEYNNLISSGDGYIDFPMYESK